MDEQNQNTTQPASKSQAGPIIAVAGIIVIVVVAVLAFQNMNKPQTQNATVSQETATNQQSTQQTTQPTTATASQYKDGTYTAVGNYISPGGAEELGVTLTIANGIITDSKVDVKATRPMSVERQTDFAEHYKDQVVGKNIDDLNLGKVSGSSLSPKGFNDAVEKIKEEAQA